MKDIGEKGVITERYGGYIKVTKLHRDESEVCPLQGDVNNPFNLNKRWSYRLRI